MNRSTAGMYRTDYSEAIIPAYDVPNSRTWHVVYRDVQQTVNDGVLQCPVSPRHPNHGTNSGYCGVNANVAGGVQGLPTRIDVALDPDRWIP